MSKIVNLSEADPETIEIINNYSSLIKEEVLARKLDFLTSQEGFTKDWKIQDPYDEIREITINIQT